MLNDAIASVGELDENEFTVATWELVAEALANAQEKLESRTQADIDAAVQAIADAKEGLAPVDYTALNAAIADAELLASLIEKKHGVKTEIITYVGSVIGAHSGPGTLALFFVSGEGAER